MPRNSRSKFRPPVRQVLQSPMHLMAFVGVCGLSPVGPGTLGPLVAALIWWFLRDMPLSAYLGMVAVLFGFGCWVCGRSAKLIGLPDYGGIVFDEVVGFLIAATPLIDVLYHHRSPVWPWLLSTFVLFRLLDILKPPPIRWFDRHVIGGLGIMLDDAVAGLITAMTVAIALFVAH